MALAFASWFPFPLFLSTVAFRRMGLLQIFCSNPIIARESIVLFLINGSRLSLARILIKILVWTRVGVMNTTYSSWTQGEFPFELNQWLTFWRKVFLEKVCLSPEHKALGNLEQLTRNEIREGSTLV